MRDWEQRPRPIFARRLANGSFGRNIRRVLACPLSDRSTQCIVFVGPVGSPNRHSFLNSSWLASNAPKYQAMPVPIATS